MEKSTDWQKTKWKAEAEEGSMPCSIDGFAAHKKNCDAFFYDAAGLHAIIPEKNIEQLRLDEAGTLLSRLASLLQ